MRTSVLEQPRSDAGDTLWRRFKGSGDPAAREGLILHYSSLVRFAAGRMIDSLPATVELGDMVQGGLFGLIDAIEKYDPDRGVRFESYAMHRIRGAILDELRTLDWAPRTVRARARALADATADLEHAHGRQPTEHELAELVGVSVEQLREQRDEIAHLHVLALDDPLGSGPATIADLCADRDAPEPGHAVERRDLRTVLADAIGSLPDRQRFVVALYHYEGLSMADIGRALGVTESRVSQIHSKAVATLRRRAMGTSWAS